MPISFRWARSSRRRTISTFRSSCSGDAGLSFLFLSVIIMPVVRFSLRPLLIRFQGKDLATRQEPPFSPPQSLNRDSSKRNAVEPFHLISHRFEHSLYQMIPSFCHRHKSLALSPSGEDRSMFLPRNAIRKPYSLRK